MPDAPVGSAAVLVLPVGQVVAFSCRRGDLLNAAHGPGAQEGIRAHSRLQKKKPAASVAEYRLEVTLSRRGRRLQLSGRADLFHPQQTPPLIEEVKSTYCPPQALAESQRYLHWSQLKFYGFCHLLQQSGHADSVRLAMLWYDLKADRVHRQEEVLQRCELEDFCLPLIDAYVAWLELVEQQRSQLSLTAGRLDFPFNDYRRGQRDLAVAVFRSLRDNTSYLAEAPTGIGKTVSSVFPAVKAMGAGHIDKVVYLTAKKQGRDAVRACLAALGAGGLQITSLVLHAKNDICECRSGGCELNEEGVCPLRLGFFDRLPAARRELLQRRRIGAETVREVAARHRLCPFELSLQVLPWVQFVVCDFNYVFDPLVGLSYFRDNDSRIGLLVDEAHNLSDRARDMYSVRFSRAAVLGLARICEPLRPGLAASIKGLARAIDRWSKPLPPGFSATAAKAPTITRAVEKLVQALELLHQQGLNCPDAVAEWLPDLYRYRKVEPLAAAVYRTMTEKAPRRQGDKTVTFKCLDAGDFLRASYTGFHGQVLFSGTLRPFAFFQPMLGLDPHTARMSLPSPFSSSQQGVVICDHIDTRYKHREPAVAQIRAVIDSTFRARPGNYLVCFPSYRYLDRVFDDFVGHYPQRLAVRQQPGSGDEVRERFLSHFDSGAETIGFAIMGGIYGEGVDYAGDRLAGVIIVGVGLPQVNPPQELMRQYYLQRGFDGFDYAYRYPGMIRVLQTAGRVIRSETDRGVVVLADRRFGASFYRRLFPAHWQVCHCRSAAGLEQALAGFWQQPVDNCPLN